MKLIVGLGNPGRKYLGTRHNAGYEVIGRVAMRLKTAEPGMTGPRSKFEGEILEVGQGENKIILLCPLTFMNLSGRSVKAAVAFYQIPPDQVLVVCDDFNLDLGRIRIRKGGSSGGQNGLSDVIEKLGTSQFPRLRLGIGRPPPQWDVKNFVLSKLDKFEREIFDQSVERAADAVQCWIDQDIQTAMNRFNTPAQRKKKQDPPDERQQRGENNGNNGNNGNQETGDSSRSRDHDDQLNPGNGHDENCNDED